MPFSSSRRSPEPYTNIKKMVKAYHKTMRDVSAKLATVPGHPQLVISGEPIGYVISPDAMKDMINKIAALPGFVNYLFLFGIDIDSDELTVCVVGADATGDVLPVYKQDGTTPGEEKWPNKCRARLSDSNIDFFMD